MCRPSVYSQLDCDARTKILVWMAASRLRAGATFVVLIDHHSIEKVGFRNIPIELLVVLVCWFSIHWLFVGVLAGLATVVSIDGSIAIFSTRGEARCLLSTLALS